MASSRTITLFATKPSPRQPDPRRGGQRADQCGHAGALAGETERHPLAGGTGGTLISGTDYGADIERAERLRPIAAEAGSSLPELGMRFALSKPGIASALVGFSSLDQIDEAVRAAEAGPLSDEVVQRIVAAAAR